MDINHYKVKAQEVKEPTQLAAKQNGDKTYCQGHLSVLFPLHVIYFYFNSTWQLQIFGKPTAPVLDEKSGQKCGIILNVTKLRKALQPVIIED